MIASSMFAFLYSFLSQIPLFRYSQFSFRWAVPAKNVNISLANFVNIFLANVNSSSCSLYVIVGPSVVCLSSVTFVRPTQTIEIFRNVSTP